MFYSGFTLMCSYIAFIKAIQIQDCDPQRQHVEVENNSSNDAIVCAEFEKDRLIEWLMDLNDRSGFRSLDSCDADGICRGPINSQYKVTRDRQGTSSNFTFTNALRQYGGYTLRCSSTSGSDNQPANATCIVNIIYPASVTTPCSLTTHPNRTMGGSCHIARAFSSAEYYACQLRQKSTATLLAATNYTVQPISGDNNYYSGTCSYSANLPTVTGNYSYDVIVYPGATVVPVSGTVTVAAPTANPTIVCSSTQAGFVAEHSNTDCYCTASDLGQPQSRLLVYHGSSILGEGNYGINNVTVRVPSVNRTDKVVRCQLDWITDGAQDMKVEYTFNVAYGPESVSIDEPGIYDRHPVSPRALTLSCTATGVNPTNVTITWSVACQSSSGNTCTLPPDNIVNGTHVTCTVRNIFANTISSGSVILRTNYPPATAPVITSYTTGQVLYDGQTRSLTCSVNGGDPPVTSVIFGCVGKSEKSYGTSKTISIKADPSMNGKICNCSAVWKNKTTDWYPLTAYVNLTVYYAPQPPLVSSGAELLPFLAGDTVTLVCSLNDSSSGNPAATLTWIDRQGSSGRGTIHLLLTLNSSHNGASVACDASNNFTIYNNSRVNTEYVLKVYYISEVKFQSLDSSACIPLSDSYCIVNEGQSVRVNCSAQSNPSLSTVAWQYSNSPVLDFIGNRSVAVDQWCNVSTVKANNDSRLPLRASKALKVFTQYTGTIREFVVNGQADNVTVNETTAVRMTCTADGRPSPALTIITDGGPVADQPKGEAISVLDVVSVLLEVREAQCQDSGAYNCHMENGATIARFLYVNCKPQIYHRVPQPKELEINYLGRPVGFTFVLVAYPLPTFSIFFAGPEKNITQTVKPDNLNVTCLEITASYNFTCNVTAYTMEKEHSGYYYLNISNLLGSSVITFRIAFNESKIKKGDVEGPDPSNAAVIGGAVAAAVSVVAIVVVVVVLFLKGRPTESAESANKSQREHLTSADASDVSTFYNVAFVEEKAGEDDKKSNVIRADYEEVCMAPGKSGTSQESKVTEKPTHVQCTTENKGRVPGKTALKSNAKGKGKLNKNIIYGNSPLNMKPTESSVYENYTLQKDDKNNKGKEIKSKPVTKSNTDTTNADGLVYSTVYFSEEQKKKSADSPPPTDVTDYASIDFTTRKI